jgi:two-component system chemotaxis sensor kinase CheA
VFVVPLDMVEECIEYSNVSGHDYANVRGAALPFIRLHRLFSMSSAPTQRQSIVIVKHAGVRAGLVVDALLGECQTVIKPLSKILAQVECVSGSSILGTGEVALILDVPSLLQQALAGSLQHGAAAADAA